MPPDDHLPPCRAVCLDDWGAIWTCADLWGHQGRHWARPHPEWLAAAGRQSSYVFAWGDDEFRMTLMLKAGLESMFLPDM